jgi:glycosyltransferase involved in cell wall biosynthesis
MCEISVIVPVYNVEKYLPKCIESILDQTYKNFELILIDDGSTDRSGEICDDYKTKDGRIVVLHKQNGGLSEARNHGIELAKSEYLTFVDSDDYMKLDFLEYLLALREKYSADLVIARNILIYENGKILKEKLDFDLKEGACSKKALYKYFLLNRGFAAHGKLYKKNIFDKIHYPIGSLYEDIAILHKIIESANVIVFGEKKGYYYLQRKGSIIHSSMTEKHLVLLDYVREWRDFILCHYPDLELPALKCYIFSYFKILNLAMYSSEFTAKTASIKKEILKYKRVILTNVCFNKKERLAILLLTLGLPVYKMVWTVYSFWKWRH